MKRTFVALLLGTFPGAALALPFGPCVKGTLVAKEGSGADATITARYVLKPKQKLCPPTPLTWVQFREVKEDSRCPADAMCADQGRARIRVFVRLSKSRIVARNLTLGALRASFRLRDTRVTFGDLQPYPLASQPYTGPKDATFDVRFPCGTRCDQEAAKLLPAEQPSQPGPDGRPPVPTVDPNCKPDPEAICTAVYAPVCAITKAGPVTFSSDCRAAAACAPILSTGECKAPCRGNCGATNPTPAPPPPSRPGGGAKKPWFDPTCTPMTEMVCPAVVAPVCGVTKDGPLRTFANECEAREACAAIINKGECETVPPTEPPPVPQPGGTTCTPNPAGLCEAMYAPLCGIDPNGVERTFGNRCELNALCGVLSYEGECQAGGRPAARPVSTVCTPSSSGCEKIYAPVCAELANGTRRTFGNECMAKAACAVRIVTHDRPCVMPVSIR